MSVWGWVGVDVNMGGWSGGERQHGWSRRNMSGMGCGGCQRRWVGWVTYGPWSKACE